MSRAARMAALITTATAFVAGVPAHGQDAKPEPTTCAGVNVTDPAGDQQLVVVVVNTGQKPPENTDIVRGFWRYVPDASGKNVLTANIEVSKLDDAIFDGSFGSHWYWYFDVGDYTWFVAASLDDAGGWTYSYGDLGETVAGNTTQGDTTGKVFEGDKGIIQIVVPVDTMKIAGKALANGYVNSKLDFQNYIPTADRAPDTGGAKSFKAEPCAATGTPTPVTPPPATAPEPGGGTPPPAPSGPATLDLKVTAPKLSARKLRKSRSFKVKLQAGEKITGLSAKLRKGKKTLGTGNLAALGPGAASLKVKLASRAAKRFKKGTYTLAFSGTKADGRKAAGSVSVRVAL